MGKGKVYDGYVTITMGVNDLHVEEGESLTDAIFPDGWEGEMFEYSFEGHIIDDEDEEDDEEEDEEEED